MWLSSCIGGFGTGQMGLRRRHTKDCLPQRHGGTRNVRCSREQPFRQALPEICRGRHAWLPGSQGDQPAQLESPGRYEGVALSVGFAVSAWLTPGPLAQASLVRSPCPHGRRTRLSSGTPDLDDFTHGPRAIAWKDAGPLDAKPSPKLCLPALPITSLNEPLRQVMEPAARKVCGPSLGTPVKV